MLKPLPLGDHRIEIHIVQIIPGQESENLFLDLQLAHSLNNQELVIDRGIGSRDFVMLSCVFLGPGPP